MKNKKMRKLCALLTIVMCFMSSTVVTAQENMYSSCTNYQLYYYSQLTDLEKGVYNNFVNSKEKFLNNESISYTIGHYDVNGTVPRRYYIDTVQRAFHAYLRDNAEATIWIKDPLIFARFSDDGTISMEGRTNATTGRYGDISTQNISTSIAEFERKSQEFVQTLNGTDAEKLTQIYNWLIQNASYDYTYNLPNTRNAYGTIVKGKSICSGFAYAYKYIADLANLKVLYVQGRYYHNGTNKGEYTPHAWNIAYVNEKWVLIDATLGATSSKEMQFNYLFTPLEDAHYCPDPDFAYPKN